MCILWFIIHVVIHFPLEWIHILYVFFLYFGGKNQQKGAYPLHTPISNDYTYDCLIKGNQLLGDVVLVIVLVIPRYRKSYFRFIQWPLYLAPLRSLFGPFSIFNIIEFQAIYNYLQSRASENKMARTWTSC